MSKLLPSHYFLALAVSFGLCTTTAWGVTPVSQPLGRTLTTYSATGTLAAITLAKRMLTISGNEFYYSAALRILSASGENLTVQALSPGQSVAYTVNAGLIPGQPYITEIQILAGTARER